MVESTKDGDIVVPGDVVIDSDLSKADKSNRVILGPGLKRRADKVIVSKPGLFKKKGNNIFWVSGFNKRYIPSRGENVVGIVTRKAGDYFKIDIGATEEASLHFLAFENATKKNRPILNVGDLVHAEVLQASPDMEPELVCVNSQGRKERLGILPKDGFVFNCSLHLIRRIRHPDCQLLSLLGSAFKYESAIGLNGKIWIRSSDTATSIAIGDAFLKAENKSFEEITDYCHRLIRCYKKN